MNKLLPILFSFFLWSGSAWAKHDSETLPIKKNGSISASKEVPGPSPVRPLPKLLPKLSRLWGVDQNTFRYNTQTETFIPTEQEGLPDFSFDPVRFTLQADQKEITEGQEVVLTITAEFLDVSPSLMFTFDGSTSYALKMVLPQGFIPTGGTYHDYMTGEVNRSTPIQRYELRGFFEFIPENPCFTLLRSFSGAGIMDSWAKKDVVCVSKNYEVGFPSRNAREAAVNCTDPQPEIIDCKVRLFFDNFNQNGTPGSNKQPCGWINLSTVDLQLAGSKSVWHSDDNVIIPNREDGGIMVGLYNTSYHVESISRTIHNAKPFINYVVRFDAAILNSYPNSSRNIEVVVTINGIKKGVLLKDIEREFFLYEFVFKQGGATSFNISFSSNTLDKDKVSYILLDNIKIIEQDNNLTPPILSTNKVSVIRGEEVTLTAQNCSGLVRWNTGQTGFQISVFPTQTSTYSAFCDKGSCQSRPGTVKIDVTSNEPVVSLSTDNPSLCPGETTLLRANVSNCIGSIEWYRANSPDSPYQKYLVDGIWITGSSLLNVSQAGVYRAKCGREFSDITITNKDIPAKPGLSSNGPAPAKLEGSCIGGILKWENMSPNEQFQLTIPNVASGTYSARCVDGLCVSERHYVEVVNPTIVGITISTLESSLCDQNTTTITANAKSCPIVNIKWFKDNIQRSEWNGSEKITVGAGTYKAVCNEVVSNTIQIITNASPLPPSLQSNRYEVLPDEMATIIVSGCLNGKIEWYRNNVLQTEVSQNRVLYVPASNATANYTATCQTSCGTSGPSNTISLKNTALTIKASVPDKEVYPNQDFTLTAIGCAANWHVEWELPDRYIPKTNRIENPLPVTGPGEYKARCVNSLSPNETTEWASIQILERGVFKPQMTSTPGCIYDNQTKTIVVSGCNGLAIEWFDGVRTANPSVRDFRPGVYTARCYSDGSNGTTFGPWESHEVCLIEPNPITISANKSSVNPLELFQISGANCISGWIQWLNPEGVYSGGNSVTMTGPGMYYGRCVVSDRSVGPWSSFNMPAKPPGQIMITANKNKARSNEPVTLTANGCSNGHVMWAYTPMGRTDEVIDRGRSITVFGHGTYYAWCVSLGISSERADYTITPLNGNIPSVSTDKQRATPNEPVFITLSGCNPNWYWLKVTHPDGRESYPATNNNRALVYGPFTYEVACINGNHGIDEKVSGSVDLSVVDQIRVVPNKQRVDTTERVLLTAYGCDFGTLEWRFGNIPQQTLKGLTTISPKGPGNYYARCVGDIRKSDDWVLAIVNPTMEIMPAISGPLRICPNTSANLTASNCPAGWHYQWFTAEGTGHTFNTVATIQLPQIVKCRCVKPDWSWWGPEQEVSVDAPFPNLFTATSNSPVPLGGELKLTVTDISDPTATYNWIPPTGMTLPSNGTRALSIPNANTTFGGTYQVEVTSSNCKVVVQTEVAVRACDDLYIKSTVQATGQTTNQLRRKPGVKPMAFEMMELTVETLDGQRIPGATYSWTVPAGVKVDVSSPKPHLIQADQVGEYKVTVSFGQGETCELKTELSGRPCQVFTDGNCNTAPVKIDTTAEPNANIPNLAVGDVFNAGDYEVTVTSLKKGSQTLGWTGEGMVEQNLIAGVKIPMSVVFENIKINSCYQYYNRGENGAVVRSKADASWGSVVDLGKDEECGEINVYIRHLQEIADLLKVYTFENKTKLQSLNDGLIKLEGQLKNDTCFSAEQKSIISNALSNSKTEISCLLTPSTARVRADNCGVNIDEKIEKNIALLLSAEDKDCNCVPTGVANEGDKRLCSGIKNHPRFGNMTCYKTYVYHTSYSGSKYPSGWYFVEDYKNIVRFIGGKIGPLIFIHGTFSDPSTFSNSFKKIVFENISALNKLPYSKIISEVQWSGENNSTAREVAAQELSLILNSNLGISLLRNFGFDRHIVLVSHSHGGNVAKLLKNKLEDLDSRWLVDLINIETPQRNDIQIKSKKGIILNIWSNGDFIQWLGSIADFDLKQPSPGPFGSRKDPVADFNIQLLAPNFVTQEQYGPAMFKWIKNSLGHSLQGDDWYRAQIYFHIYKYFSK